MKLISLGLLLAVAGSAMASSAATAKSLLDGASATAQHDKKNVLVIFHASWCGWCKKLDAMLETPEYKKLFEDSFVIVHVDVEEHDAAHKPLENEGGEDLMTQLGTTDKSLPFFAVLTPGGKKLGDSNYAGPKGKLNMGFPAEPQEIAAFKVLLKKGAPHMSAEDISTVEAHLKELAVKH